MSTSPYMLRLVSLPLFSALIVVVVPHLVSDWFEWISFPDPDGNRVRPPEKSTLRTYAMTIGKRRLYQWQLTPSEGPLVVMRWT
jgi:hypothetical protein